MKSNCASFYRRYGDVSICTKGKRIFKRITMVKKYALVTGGSRGIGKAIAIKLAKDLQYHVLINYQSNEQAALETQQIIENEGGSAEIIKFDVASFDETQSALNNWKQANEEAVMEVIVNNAGITRDGLFMWMQPNDWNSVINTSLNGFYNVTNFFIQDMLRKKYGRIINMVSVSGVKGTAGQTNYSAAKGAIVAVTKALAQEGSSWFYKNRYDGRFR